MGYNIGPKIGIEGEQEFRESIRKINDTYKALDAETRKLTASFEAQGDEQGKLEAASKQLQKQIDNQRDKQKLLEDAVAKATAKFGENSIEAIRLRGALYDTQATISNLENELRSTNAQLGSIGGAMEDLAEDTDVAGDAVLSFGDVLKANLASGVVLDVLQDVGQAVKDIAEESIEAAANIRAESAQFDQAFGDMADSAKDSLGAIADETKIAETRMQGSFTKIYAFAKSVGTESDDALGIASRALQAAADSAAYYDRSVEDATETLQAFLKGNYANDAALGIAATETTRNAKANELYAKSFKDLSESQKVDVLLSMVEAGNAASGALGSAAREADEWTNVNGELAESWRQFLGVIGDPLLNAVIPAVQGMTGALKQATASLSSMTVPDALTASMKNFEETISGANSQLTQTQQEIELSSYAAGHYADRLEELEAAGLDTAAAQQEYALVVEELNRLIPDLNLSIDEQTGLVNTNINAIRADIAAWKEYATAAAIQEKFSNVLKAQGSAKAELITAQAKLNMLATEEEILTGQRTAAINALDAAQNELTAAQQEYDRLLNTGSQEWLEAADRLDAAKASVDTLTQEYESLQIEIDNNAAEQKKLNQTIEDAEETLKSYDEELKLAEASVQLYGQTTDEATNSVNKQSEAVEKAAAHIQPICQAYEDAKEKSLDSINTQIGLFDELTQKSDTSASKILENWKKQQQAFQDYQSNLQKAVDLGLDETLVQQLADGSQQSMLILDALVNDTEISVDEINEAFNGVSESKDSLSSTLAAMAVMADEELADMVSAFNQSGINSIDGLIAGIVSRQPAFKRSLAETAKLGLAGYNEEMAINSPARKMIPSGEFTVEGAIVGVENMEKAYRESMSNLALAGENAFLTTQLDLVGSYPSVVQAPAAVSQSTAYNYGGISISIHQQPGESSEDLAYRVMEIIQQEVESKEAGIGG